LASPALRTHRLHVVDAEQSQPRARASSNGVSFARLAASRFCIVTFEFGLYREAIGLRHSPSRRLVDETLVEAAFGSGRHFAPASLVELDEADRRDLIGSRV